MSFSELYLRIESSVINLHAEACELAASVQAGVILDPTVVVQLGDGYRALRDDPDAMKILNSTETMHPLIRELGAAIGILMQSGALHGHALCACEVCGQPLVERPPQSSAEFIAKYALPEPPSDELSSASMARFMQQLHAWLIAQLQEMFDSEVPLRESEMGLPGVKYQATCLKDLAYVVEQLTRYESLRSTWTIGLSVAETEWGDLNRECWRLRHVSLIRLVYTSLYQLPEHSPGDATLVPLAGLSGFVRRILGDDTGLL